MSARDKAHEAWGTDLPDWVERVADEVDRTSQSRTAKRLGYSAPSISNLLGNRYGATLGMIEERVRGILMREVVDCPGLDEITKDECQDWRKKAKDFSPHNPTRVRMYRACHRCPIFKSNQRGEGAA